MNFEAAEERELEAKLDQDKAIIQAVARQEMLKARLRRKCESLANNRAPITQESRAVDEKGKPLRGRRKTQNYFVTEQDIMHNVMKRLKMPEEAFEAAKLVEEEERQAALAQGEGSAPVVEGDCQDAAFESSDDEEVTMAEIKQMFAAAPPVEKPGVRVPIVRVKQGKSLPKAPAQPKAKANPRGKPKGKAAKRRAADLAELDRTIAQFKQEDALAGLRAYQQPKGRKTLPKIKAS